MKKVAFILILFIQCLNIFPDNIVNIWANNNSQYMGVSQERLWLKSYFLSNFEYYSTLDTETKNGVLTAITASRDLYFLLDELLMFEKQFVKESITITKEGGIYHFFDNKIFLEFSFSLEKPGEKIFNIINEVYKDNEKTKTIVTNHYLESWVIRIYSAENVISPDINTLDFDDIIITATLIGESSQWLWGIHDGVDLIYKSLK
ncbi:MAG: hypothetical protein OCD02_20760 [Spirochaetaceae bacterium]